MGARRTRGRGQQQEGTKLRDPSCGEGVDPNGARWTSAFQATTFYFCSRACKDMFEASPMAVTAAAVLRQGTQS